MSFCAVKKELGLAVAALGLLATGAAQAVGILNPVATPGAVNPVVGYDVVSPGLLGPVTVTPANLAGLLAGDASAPGGNVELGKVGQAPATTLTGTLDGKSITLSGLVYADWADGNGALAERYILDAADSIGLDLSLYPGDPLQTIKSQFLGGGAWMAVSDPNVAYVNHESGELKIGLEGFFDAGPVLQQMFGALVQFPPNFSVQVSEAVKVEWQGDTHYLYGFNATATNQATADGSYSGNYEVGVKVPVPATLALMLLGLVGIAGMRRAA